MKNQDLYNEFLINKEIIEGIKGKKLEQTKIENGIQKYSINPEILDNIIDSLALSGNIKKEEKDIYKNSYLFARKVAYHDLYMGSRGILHDQIMKEIFENAEASVKSVKDETKSLTDSIKYQYNECSNSNLYQKEIIDFFGLKDGKIKDHKTLIKKYGNIEITHALSSFCNLFIEKAYKKSQRKVSTK